MSDDREEISYPLQPLTRGEQDVVALLLEGYSNAKMAERLTVSVATIENRMSKIYPKYGYEKANRASLIATLKIQRERMVWHAAAEANTEIQQRAFQEANPREQQDPEQLHTLTDAEIVVVQSGLSRSYWWERYVRRGLLVRVGLLILLAMLAWKPVLQYIWKFYARRVDALPLTSAQYYGSEKIVNHWDGWCAAWPLRVESTPFGPQLYFSSQVKFGDFEVSHFWLFYKGTWVAPTIANPNGVTDPDADKVYQVRREFEALYPDSLQVDSWYYSYRCDLPGPDPAGEGTDPSTSSWCTIEPIALERNENGFYFIYFDKAARLGDRNKHPFEIRFRDKSLRMGDDIFTWQYNVSKERWEMWITRTWARWHPNLEKKDLWTAKFVCPK